MTKRLVQVLGTSAVVRSSPKLELADYLFTCPGVGTLAFMIIPELKLRDPKIVAEMVGRFQVILVVVTVCCPHLRLHQA